MKPAPGRPKQDALERFAAKCQFNAVTGCVEWIGGTTCGKGNTAKYGSFWFEGRRWFAHRWAAKHIHGLEIEGLDVDHKCRNSLCQQHLQAIPQDANAALRWVRVQHGAEEPPPDGHHPDMNGVPFFEEPAWLKPFLIMVNSEENDDGCPF